MVKISSKNRKDTVVFQKQIDYLRMNYDTIRTMT